MKTAVGWVLVASAMLMGLVVLQIWRWGGANDEKLISEIKKGLPPSAASGQKVAFISKVDRCQWRKLYGLAGVNPEIDKILEPRDVDDLARMLKILGKGKTIARLTFWGTGTPKGKEVALQFTDKAKPLEAGDFKDLQTSHPNLPDAFSTNADVIFFNCFAGIDDELLEQAGKAFLGKSGGTVIANEELTHYETSGEIFGFCDLAVVTGLDLPDQESWKRVPISPRP